MMENTHYGYYFLVFVLIFAACNRDDEIEDLFPLNAEDIESEEIAGRTFNTDEVHPKQENIPHSDVAPIALSPIDISEANDVPEPLEYFYRFLNENEDLFEISNLNFFTSNNIFFHVESLNDSTLILSDDRSNELHHYHLNRNESEMFAPEGRGPGDIFFNREVQLLDETLYVAMEGFRISQFDCSVVPCEHEKEINTKFNHYSVAPADEKLVVLGIPPYMGPDTDHENPGYILHEIDSECETVESFSPAYNHDSVLLHIHFTMGNRVRYLTNGDLFLMTNSRLPFIYSYNSDYELINKYLLPGFSPEYQLYDSEHDMGRSYRHHSNIYHIREVDNNWLLVQIRHLRDAVPKEGYEESFSYYAFNVNNETLYHIGEDYAESMDESRAIFLTDHGLIINQQGSLQWVGMK